MDEIEFLKQRQELQKKAGHLRRNGTLNRDIGKALQLTPLQYKNLFRIEPLPYSERRKITPNIQKQSPRSRKSSPSVFRPWEILRKKLLRFTRGEKPITCHQIIDRFGVAPKCYLTGRPIDYEDAITYQLDHFVARSKGGASSLANLRLCCPVANRMKSHLAQDEFIALCAEIAAHGVL